MLNVDINQLATRERGGMINSAGLFLSSIMGPFFGLNAYIEQSFSHSKIFDLPVGYKNIETKEKAKPPNLESLIKKGRKSFRDSRPNVKPKHQIPTRQKTAARTKNVTFAGKFSI